MVRVNKKGDLRDITVYLIALLVGFVVLFFLFQGVSSYIQTKGNEEACRLSVVGADESFGILEVDCPRQTVLISENHYTVDNRKKQYYLDDYGDNVLRVFADHMVSCWDKLGADDVDLFGTSVLPTNACLVCDHIAFVDPPEDIAGDLMKYITLTPIPLGAFNDIEETYYAHLYREQEDFDWGGNIHIHDDIIATNKEYAIVYSKTMGGGMESPHSISVMTTDRLGSACTYMYN